MRVLMFGIVLWSAACAAPREAGCGVYEPEFRVVEGTCKWQFEGWLAPNVPPSITLVVERVQRCDEVEVPTRRTRGVGAHASDVLVQSERLDGVIATARGSFHVADSQVTLDVNELTGPQLDFDGQPVKMKTHLIPDRLAAAVPHCDAIRGASPDTASTEQLRSAVTCGVAGWHLPVGWYTAALTSESD